MGITQPPGFVLAKFLSQSIGFSLSLEYYSHCSVLLVLNQNLLLLLFVELKIET